MSRVAASQPIQRSIRGPHGRPRAAVRLLTVPIAAFLLAATTAAGAASGTEGITVAVPPDRAPWSSAEDGGAPRGILVDLWREWEGATATPVTFVVMTGDDALRAVRAGEVDVVGGHISTAPVPGFLATDELLHVPIEAYVRAGGGITTLEKLSGVTVGVVSPSAAFTALTGLHHELEAASYADPAALYAAVAVGSLRAFADERLAAREGLAEAGALGEFDRVTPPLDVAGVRALVAPGSEALRHRLASGMDGIGGEARRAIMDRWTLAAPRRFDAGHATMWLLVIALVAGLAGHSLTVRRQVKHRTAALEASRNELATMNQRLRDQATHDLLTGLANRRLFVERVGQAIAAARRSGDRVGLLYLDLDEFKTVNDRWGHGAGDEALVVIAERVRGCVRQADTPARLGGDEFAVLVDRIDGPEDAKVVAAKLAAACARPLVVGRGVYRIGASIGIAMFPDDGHDADGLLAVADRRMYLAKMRAKGLEFLPRATTPPEGRIAISG